MIYLVEFTQPDPMGQAYSFTETLEAFASKVDAENRCAQLRAEHSEPLYRSCSWGVREIEVK